MNHAPKADVGAFTNDQLCDLKREGRTRAAEVKGRFDWMRRDLFALVGGNLYYETPIIFRINDHPCIWFNRSKEGLLLLNFSMPTVTDEPRAQVRDNDWIIPPEAATVVECPPNGRILRIRYNNGDRLRIEFISVSFQELLATGIAGNVARLGADLTSVTIVEVSEKVSGTPIEFGPRSTRVGAARYSGSFFHHNDVAIQHNIPPSEFALLHLDVEE